MSVLVVPGSDARQFHSEIADLHREVGLLPVTGEHAQFLESRPDPTLSLGFEAGRLVVVASMGYVNTPNYSCSTFEVGIPCAPKDTPTSLIRGVLLALEDRAASLTLAHSKDKEVSFESKIPKNIGNMREGFESAGWHSRQTQPYEYSSATDAIPALKTVNDYDIVTLDAQNLGESDPDGINDTLMHLSPGRKRLDREDYIKMIGIEGNRLVIARRKSDGVVASTAHLAQLSSLNPSIGPLGYELNGVATRPEDRGRGLAEALTRQVLGEAAKRTRSMGGSFIRVQLNTLNPTAADVYIRSGFKATNELSQMSKTLAL